MLHCNCLTKILKLVLYANTILLICLIPLSAQSSDSKQFIPAKKTIEVGVGTVDITPSGPIRLGGYASREGESEGVAQPLYAKALAFGKDGDEVSVLISVDLLGIPKHVSDQVKKYLFEKKGVDPSQVVILATHTHTGPRVTRALNSYGKLMPAVWLGHMSQYLDTLPSKIVEAAQTAIETREPSLVDWGQGEVSFAVNRRVLSNGKWTGFGVQPDGPVDHSLPLLRVRKTDGTLRALLINYACHATTLEADFNRIHGDWPGETQRIIEERHPGVTALIAIGAGGDANPEPRGNLSDVSLHAKEIANEVERLLTDSLQPISEPPTGRIKNIDLPYANIPNIKELVDLSSEDGSVGEYARRTLDQMLRGESIPKALSYPIQTWTFGEDLAMVFLAGEVVVDYSLRLKDSLGSEHIWINAYANETPTYIASSRVISEGGYEAEYSMYSYGHPGPFVRQIEDLIIAGVYDLLPASFLN